MRTYVCVCVRLCEFLRFHNSLPDPFFWFCGTARCGDKIHHGNAEPQAHARNACPTLRFCICVVGFRGTLCGSARAVSTASSWLGLRLGL